MATTGVVAALIAALGLGFVEAFRAVYPTQQTWFRLRRVRGRSGVRSMRKRLEHAASRRTPLVLTGVLVAFVLIWVASASLLDKRWYEVALDTCPYIIIGAAMLRAPPALRKAAERMRDYERSAGEDPDAAAEDEGGPSALAL
jgi:hypothetical protein